MGIRQGWDSFKKRKEGSGERVDREAILVCWRERGTGRRWRGAGVGVGMGMGIGREGLFQRRKGGWGGRLQAGSHRLYLLAADASWRTGRRDSFEKRKVGPAGRDNGEAEAFIRIALDGSPPMTVLVNKVGGKYR